ncbi:MAG: ATP-dependent helicase HrpB, partial [Thermodesulfobacteriota bacterium]|nr:ATP-dependent helicase HrpB [Thermodesulfobacteriota bacterium]
AVLQAPPGAGKTTFVPLFLQKAAWLGHGKIVMLEPRRLAARAAAMRMADLLDEAVGQTVGYRVRMDTRVSEATRIEVVTEGILTRMLQSDPALEGVGLVICDEFHERSLDGDLGLALCLDMQGVLNQKLRLLVMSATMDAGPVAAMLNHAPVISCSGRAYPVETRYVGAHTPTTSPAMTMDAVYKAVTAAAREETGSILVFLPGAPEIRQVAKRLDEVRLGPEWIVAPLFGNLSRSAQDQAISPPPKGRRKIVLATPVAETSLTIEGIRVVVDSGLQRVPRFDVKTGLTRLVTVPVSQASADQRRGRAGRTGPGLCLRLWSQRMHHSLPPFHRPEILEADLARLTLELALWGVDDPHNLRWLDRPPKASYDSARRLLQALKALDGEGRITAHGRRIAALPAHPRMAHMMVAAQETGQGAAACDLAALLSERDVVHFHARSQNPDRTDMGMRFDLVQAARQKAPLFLSGATIDHAALGSVIRVAAQLRRRLGCKGKDKASPSIGRLLAWAYPERIAQRRSDTRGKFLLASGRGASLDPEQVLAAEAFIVAMELDGRQGDGRIFKAASYSKEDIQAQFPEDLQWEESIDWDPARQAVAAKKDLKLGALCLQSEPLLNPDPEAMQKALIQGIQQAGLRCLPWTKKLRQWQERVVFVHRHGQVGKPWPDLSEATLSSDLETWLAPYLTGVTGLRDVARIDLKGALFSFLSYEQHKNLDKLAPTHLTVPSGSRIPIDYGGDRPVLAVRLQEMFGLEKTPAVLGGRKPLLIHLLSPAGRPVQITSDLAGFWKRGYVEVKKELKGRYPKHYWPDDPLQAQATARVRPKGKK